MSERDESMIFRVQRIDYRNLNGKQQENHNFAKVAGYLAEYGFHCIRLTDDWKGADFLAVHINGEHLLKVQLKSRVGIEKKYSGRKIYMAFPIKNTGWYLIAHEKLVEIFDLTTNALNTSAWKDRGAYHSRDPSVELRNALEEYRIDTGRDEILL